MMENSGPVLDRLVELHVFGRKPVTDVPPYSTNESEAELVVRALEAPHRRWQSLESANGWTFVWFRTGASRRAEQDRAEERYVRISSATAPTRAHATCLAALKLVGRPAERRGKSRKRPR